MKLLSLLKRARPSHLLRRLLVFSTSLTNLSPADRRRYWRLRYLLPAPYRRFFEGAPGVPGQMWVRERRLLFHTVRAHRPQVVCESGTWLGGGSTYFIASALKQNGMGLLHTTEAHPPFYEKATGYYRDRLPDLQSHVVFHLGKSMEVYPQLLPTLPPIDLLLLDGAEEAQETWDEFALFEPFLAPDAVVVAHDWGTEKMALMRPFIENHDEWQIERQLQPPFSVGMVVLRRTQSNR